MSDGEISHNMCRKLDKFKSGIPQENAFSIFIYICTVSNLREPRSWSINHRRRPPTTSPLPLQNPLFVWASKGRFRPIFHVNCLQKCQPISRNHVYMSMAAVSVQFQQKRRISTSISTHQQHGPKSSVGKGGSSCVVTVFETKRKYR